MPTIDIPDPRKSQPRPIRILVAEDEASVRVFIERALADPAHHVEAVADGQEALVRLATARTPFDLLIADIVMPNLDGIGLALKVAKDFPDLRIILISGYAMERQRAHNIETLTERVLAKPFSIDELRDMVRAALNEPREAAAQPRSLP